MKVTTPQMHIEETYTLHYDWRDRPGSGFSFPCDQDGNVLIHKLRPAGRENYARCLDGRYNVVRAGIRREISVWYDALEGDCDVCGTPVKLVDPAWNECDGCGAFYSGSGQRLMV